MKEETLLNKICYLEKETGKNIKYIGNNRDNIDVIKTNMAIA